LTAKVVGRIPRKGGWCKRKNFDKSNIFQAYEDYTISSQLKRVDFKVGLKFATPEIQASDLTDGAEYEVAKRGPGLPGGTL
jgi:hypothetical protein